MRKPLVVIMLVMVIAAGGTVPAWATGDAAQGAPGAVADVPPVLLAVTTAPPEEEFYFGEGEEAVWRQKQLELTRFQDRTGRATKTMERVIGLTMLTTGVMIASWGAFFYYDRHTPYDYYFGGEKYKELGYVPLIKEHEIYWPSLVAGAALSGASLYILVRPQTPN